MKAKHTPIFKMSKKKLVETICEMQAEIGYMEGYIEDLKESLKTRFKLTEEEKEECEIYD